MPRTAPNPETLEEARELLLQYTNELNQIDQQVENLTTAARENVDTINELRTLNQKLFLRVSQGQTEDPNPSHDENRETLEEFATKNLKGMIR